MPTLFDRVKAFLNPQVQAPATGTPAAVIAEDVYSRFRVERDRIAVIKDCRTMYDGDPRVEMMHRKYARDLLRGGFVVKTDNSQAYAIVMAMQERLKLNQSLEDWLRLSMRDGDSFLENTVAQVDGAAYQIESVTRKPTLQMFRNTNKADQFSNPAQAFWMSDTAYMGTDVPADATWFPSWKIIHARWNHDEESRYGRPMMKSARKQYKYVEDGELNVAVRRKIGGAQLRQHVIEGSASDVETYKENNKAALGKLAAVIDFFSNKASSLTVHQGDGNIDKIGDVKHHIETMFTASDVPMELMAYGGDLNRDVLGEKKEAYEENLNQGREWATAQILQPLIELEWLLHGILPADVKYKIVWRKAKSLSPTDLRDLADAAMRLRVLGMKEEAIQTVLAAYMRDVDIDIMTGDGMDSTAFANNLKGLSI